MPSLIPLDNILGVAYIGIMLSTVVYGITCLQVYLYYTEHSENDGRFLKTFVAVLMAMDTIHVALSSSSYYHYTVTNFGDYIVLAKTTWSLGAQGTVGIFLSLLVQWFFAYRIYLLSGRRRIIPALICLISLAHMVLGGVVYVINALELVFFASSSSNLPYGISTLALDMSCDFIIAVTMVYYLRRGHTNISVRTNGAIRLLVIYTMNTCVLTTMCAAASLVSLAVSSNTLISSLFFFVLVRLYLCSLMTTLNSRATVRQKLSGDGGITISTLRAMSGSSTDNDTRTTTEGQSNGGENATTKIDSVKTHARNIDGFSAV